MLTILLLTIIALVVIACLVKVMQPKDHGVPQNSITVIYEGKSNIDGSDLIKGDIIRECASDVDLLLNELNKPVDFDVYGDVISPGCYEKAIKDYNSTVPLLNHKHKL